MLPLSLAMIALLLSHIICISKAAWSDILDIPVSIFFFYLPSIFKKDTLSPITPAESFKDRNIQSKGRNIQGK